MHIRTLVAMVAWAVSAAAPAEQAQQSAAVEQKRDPAASLRFTGDIMASMPGRRPLYVLLGSGFLRPLTSGKPATFISDWLHAHPSAVVIPVSRMLSTNRFSGEQIEIVYIWIEDGGSSLNVDLVRRGFFVAGAMVDMVDNQTALDALLRRSPKLADIREDMARERLETPQDRTERLVGDSVYKARLTQFQAAERLARREKLGIWSDAMKAERQAEGLR
jgi:hypothetical protein